MSEDIGTPSVESAVEQLAAAVGHEVTGISMNLAEGKVELLLGEKSESPSGITTPTIEDGDDEGVSVGDMGWNDLVSLASKTVGFEGETRDELEAKLRDGGVSPTIEDGDDEEASHEVTVEGLAKQVTEGEMEASDARQKAKSEGLEAGDVMKAAFGDCQSRRDCGHGANGEEAVYCFVCQKSHAAPDPDAFGITEEQSDAAKSLWDNGDFEDISEVVKVFA